MQLMHGLTKAGNEISKLIFVTTCDLSILGTISLKAELKKKVINALVIEFLKFYKKK